MLAVLLLNRMRARRQNLRKKQPKVPKKQQETEVSEQIVDYCRTCLNSNNLVEIFYNEDTALKRSEDLKLVTGLEIRYNDGLSQKMCTKCMETLNLALQFIIISVKNDWKLRKLFQNSNIFLEKNNEVEYLEEYEIVENNNMDESHNFKASYNKPDQKMVFVDDYVDHDYLEKDAAPKVNQEQQHMINSKSRADSIYKCHICDKEYNRKQTYRAHVRSHSSFCICEECGKRCFSNSMLLEHKRAVHGLARIHHCLFCDYSSATKAGLVVHERRHTGERKFVCEHCGASFHSRGGLVQHLPIHSAESNFECDICNKREKSKRLLQHHYHKVHREKRLRYLCPVCQDVFKSTSGARQHLVKSHGVPRCDQPAIQRFEISIPQTT